MYIRFYSFHVCLLVGSLCPFMVLFILFHWNFFLSICFDLCLLCRCRDARLLRCCVTYILMTPLFLLFAVLLWGRTRLWPCNASYFSSRREPHSFWCLPRLEIPPLPFSLTLTSISPRMDLPCEMICIPMTYMFLLIPCVFIVLSPFSPPPSSCRIGDTRKERYTYLHTTALV